MRWRSHKEHGLERSSTYRRLEGLLTGEASSPPEGEHQCSGEGHGVPDGFHGEILWSHGCYHKLTYHVQVNMPYHNLTYHGHVRLLIAKLRT
jgi:hypothetical protein